MDVLFRANKNVLDRVELLNYEGENKFFHMEDCIANLKGLKNIFWKLQTMKCFITSKSLKEIFPHEEQNGKLNGKLTQTSMR